MHRFVLATDRGGHLHNAAMLLDQMELSPHTLVTTYGPDIESVKDFPHLKSSNIKSVPYLFSWLGKKRIFNPIKVLYHVVVSFFQAVRLRPHVVVSLGAANVVFFCYWAKLFGAEIYHVECMNQVKTRSVTGTLLYPVCTKLYVQWTDLLPRYGEKAEYVGWVL